MTLLPDRIDLTNHHPNSLRILRGIVALQLSRIDPPAAPTDDYWKQRADETERRHQLLKRSAYKMICHLDDGYLRRPAGARHGEPFASLFDLHEALVRAALAAGDHIADRHGTIGHSNGSAAGLMRTLATEIVRTCRDLNDIPVMAWETEYRRTTEPDNEYAQKQPTMPTKIFGQIFTWADHPTLDTEEKRVAWYTKRETARKKSLADEAANRASKLVAA